MERTELDKLFSLISEYQKFVVIPHINPDGDAMGSTLAMKQYIEVKGKTATVIAPNKFPMFYSWMPGAKDVVLFDDDKKRASSILDDAEVLLFLDFNDLSRVEDLQKTIAELHSAPKTVIIDHHRDPKRITDVLISEVGKSSTSEMVYDIIMANGDGDTINSNIAACIYTGILTDTGSFRFNSTTSSTHRAVAHLIDCGIEPDLIYEQIFDNNNLSRLRLTGHALVNRLVMVGERASYMALNLEELERFDYRKGDTEGLVNYGLGIKGVVLTLFMRESREGYVKISLRSKGNVDVNSIARNHFNGGGHKNAAGGKFYGSIEESIAVFQNVVNELL
jgi:phosphoesterase RecJ-like protein